MDLDSSSLALQESARPPRPKVHVVFEFAENLQQRWRFPPDSVVEVMTPSEPYEVSPQTGTVETVIDHTVYVS
jgi:hypothetical protein